MTKFWMVVHEKSVIPLSFARHATEDAAKREADAAIVKGYEGTLLVMEAVLAARKATVQWDTLTENMF